MKKMVSDPDRDDQKVFRTMIEAFEQTNMERSHIVNNQGKILEDFAKGLNTYSKTTKDASKIKEDVLSKIEKFNKGNLFDNIPVGDSFRQIQEGDAVTGDVTSVTGNKLGTNELLEAPAELTDDDGINAIAQTLIDVTSVASPVGLAASLVSHGMKPARTAGQLPRDMFVAQKEAPNARNKIGRVTLPPGMNPPPLVDKNVTNDGKNLLESYWDYMNERRRLLADKSDEEVSAMGYPDMTYEQYLEDWKNKNPEEAQLNEQEKEENKAKRLASKRLAADIDAYNNQGQEANEMGFDVGSEPTLLSIPIDGVRQTMLMFSPEWHKVQGAAGKSDDEFLLDLDAEDQEARERLQKAKEAEERRAAEEKKRREREQAILDYSAKITKDGYIEVKIGEDVPAMQEAWALHMRKRREALSKFSEAEVDKMGLKDYDWDSWCRYYRKMHGLPEDGIKRIPINAEKKPREIDWSDRSALSMDELSKFGIEVSEDGPVMIPLDKAMEVANSLLNEAKTIYTVRDGLEVMRQGLDTEAKNLKKRNEAGPNIGVIQSPRPEKGPTDIMSAESSSYSEAG